VILLVKNQGNFPSVPVIPGDSEPPFRLQAWEQSLDPMVRKILLRILASVAILFSALLAFALGQAFHVRATGNSFLSDVRKLSVGHSTYDDLLRIQANYRSYSSIEGNKCDRDLCILDFSFDNKLLCQLGLVPGAMFVGGLRVEKGILVGISLSIVANPQLHAAMEERLAAPNLNPYEIGGKRFVSRPAYSYVWAHITSAASEEERSKVYGFNLWCLTRLGGCKDSIELLPVLKPLGPNDQGAAGGPG
jgi:hypothetical protein